MFTGIITDIGRIEAAEQRGDLRLRIGCGYSMGTVDLGASIACSGVCLTVVDKGDSWFAVDVSAETQSRTPAGMWEAGNRLNLERALRVGDELGGHIVTGSCRRHRGSRGRIRSRRLDPRGHHRG
jgi:riboflavin synthase